MRSPVLTGAFARPGRPPTSTRPSLISRWSCEREWPGSTAARYRSSRSPAYSSDTSSSWWGIAGPRSGRLRKRALAGTGSLLRTTRQPRQHEEAHRHEHDRDELRGREDAEDEAARVAAVELDHEPRDPVQQHVQPERASRVGAPAALAHEEQAEDEQLGPALIELCRVERNAERRPDVGRRGGVRERHGPRHVRRTPIAAPRREAAQPPDRMPER